VCSHIFGSSFPIQNSIAQMATTVSGSTQHPWSLGYILAGLSLYIGIAIEITS
jgi:hypothetical protein